jgi:hypothetical protein
MRFAAIAASVLALAGALAALPASSGAPSARVSFRVSGSVSGLYPGAKRSLVVTVKNPFRRRLRLVSLRATARPARRGCSGWNVEVRPFAGRRTIRPRGSARVRLLARMPASVAEECKGARFPLVFRGRAVRL